MAILWRQNGSKMVTFWTIIGHKWVDFGRVYEL